MSDAKSRIRKRIEINTPMYGYTTSYLSYDAMIRILKDAVIDGEDYIEFVTDEKLRVAVRKKDIVSIEEVE